MIYIKSLLAGAAAFIVTEIISGTIALALIVRYPRFSMRVFPAQRFDIVLGSHYYINFPLWQIVAAGAVAFIVGFAWELKTASASG
jgi:hypothetical protein